ncbi:MAG: glycosyltransferase family 2 protein [Eubacterium sp.]|nr:glycosyltransferase family 2 protein [Eubacterium sp.]MCI8919719.1 glycosyltransferase family 2 protein [Eubacterium sp.]
MKKEPLVSVCIPNYNYGHYLGYCLESVLNQTYQNLEVIFSDNASTDNSYEIAYEYKKKFEDRGIYFHLNNNKHNLGSSANSTIVTSRSEGEFVYTLASDDAIKPEFIEKCVRVFQEYPSVGMVMVNREEIDENGEVYKQTPFYNTSCVINGEDQAAVFMMAGIAIPAQRMVRNSFSGRWARYCRKWNVAGDWYDNFLVSCFADIAYLKEDLTQYRVHSGNETNESEKNLMGIFEHYQLINAFTDLAKACRLEKPVRRYDEAVSHLGDMCLRYALRMLRDNETEAAKRYLMLAPVMKASIVENEKYVQLMNIVNLADSKEIRKRAEEFREKNNLNRTISYDPPEGFTTLNLN